MATETLKKRTYRVALDDGTDSDGKQLYVYDNISMLGGLSTSGWDGDKALAIATALEPCLSRDLLGNETVATYSLTAN